MTIFNYTSSPEVKISQKVLGGLLFFDSHCTSFRLPVLSFTNGILTPQPKLFGTNPC